MMGSWKGKYLLLLNDANQCSWGSQEQIRGTLVIANWQDYFMGQEPLPA